MSGDVRVVFLVGAGRSGSTILDIAMSSHPALVSVGELKELARVAWRENRYCACGARARECPFWSGVVETLVRGSEEPEPLERLARLQRRHLSGRRLLRGLLRPAGSRSAASYREAMGRLYQAVGSVSGKSVIVDSSKAPGLARALLGTPGVDLKLVHLVRDARAVAWSLRKGFEKDLKAGLGKEIRPRPVWAAAVNWMVKNITAEMLCRRVGRANSVRVRYEDFVADPRESLERISPVVGEDLAGVGEVVASGGALTPGHLIAGNRIRMEQELRLRPAGRTWTRRLTRRQKLLVASLTWPLMLRYGYYGVGAAAKEDPGAGE